jgi:MFS family permease
MGDEVPATGTWGRGPRASRSARASLLAAFLSMSVVFGVLYSFGVYFVAINEEIAGSNSTTALIFSLTNLVAYLLGARTGRLADRVGPVPLLRTGAIALALGLVITASSSSLWVMYVGYGIGVGVAVACGYVPMVATVSAWYEERRAAATGFAVSGIGFGTAVGGPAATFLLVTFGWRTALLLTAVIGSAILFVASLIASPPPSVGLDAMSGRSPTRITPMFLHMYGVIFFFTVSTSVVLVFITPSGLSRGLTAPRAGALLGIIGVTSVIGRILFGQVAARRRAAGVMQVTLLCNVAAFLLWMLPTDAWMLSIVAVVYGVSYGGFGALLPAVIAERFGISGIGQAIGALYTAAGFAAFLGAAAGGLILDVFDDYLGVILLGLGGLLGAIIVLHRSASLEERRAA